MLKLPIVVIQKFCYYGNVTSHFSSLYHFLSYCNFPLSFVGHGLLCYQCESDKSYDDCVHKNDTACSSVSDRCSKGFFEAEKDGQTLKRYGKDCATKAICDDGCKVLESQGFNVKTCDFSCCDSDLCNGAKVPMASCFLFFACAFIVFFH